MPNYPFWYARDVVDALIEKHTRAAKFVEQWLGVSPKHLAFFFATDQLKWNAVKQFIKKLDKKLENSTIVGNPWATIQACSTLVQEMPETWPNSFREYLTRRVSELKLNLQGKRERVEEANADEGPQPPSSQLEFDYDATGPSLP